MGIVGDDKDVLILLAAVDMEAHWDSPLRARRKTTASRVAPPANDGIPSNLNLPRTTVLDTDQADLDRKSASHSSGAATDVGLVEVESRIADPGQSRTCTRSACGVRIWGLSGPARVLLEALSESRRIPLTDIKVAFFDSS